MRVEDLAPEDRALWEAMGKATPRFSSMPTPGARHELKAVETIARIVGKPLMPWQRWEYRVLTERRADRPDRYRFPEATVTVPRQSSKTTGTNILLLSRAIANPGRRSFYTAQTGKDAGERWNDLCEMAMRSPLGPQLKWRKAIGSQRLVVEATDSRISPFAPTPESLHGYTPHDVVLDECFAFDAVQGNDLMGAIKPAQQTIRDRQLIMLSTAGHAGSTFLRERVDMGRIAAENPGTNIGFMEWSFPPEMDPYDESTWEYHPAMGHLIEAEDLRELAASTPKGEFLRAFANQWVENSNPLFDMPKWRSLAEPLERVPMSDVVLGFSMAGDRSRASVVAAWALPDGRRAVRIVVSTNDVAGFASRVLELDEQRPLALVADDGGLDRTLIDDVRRALPSHRGVTHLTPGEWVKASTGLAAAIEDGTVAHDGDDVLTAALAAAQSKPMGESWAMSHKSRPEAVAACAALRGLAALPRRAPAPFIYLAQGSA